MKNSVSPSADAASVWMTPLPGEIRPETRPVAVSATAIVSRGSGPTANAILLPATAVIGAADSSWVFRRGSGFLPCAITIRRMRPETRASTHIAPIRQRHHHLREEGSRKTSEPGDLGTAWREANDLPGPVDHVHVHGAVGGDVQVPDIAGDREQVLRHAGAIQRDAHDASERVGGHGGDGRRAIGGQRNGVDLEVTHHLDWVGCSGRHIDLDQRPFPWRVPHAAQGHHHAPAVGGHADPRSDTLGRTSHPRAAPASARCPARRGSTASVAPRSRARRAGSRRGAPPDARRSRPPGVLRRRGTAR